MKEKNTLLALILPTFFIFSSTSQATPITYTVSETSDGFFGVSNLEGPITWSASFSSLELEAMSKMSTLLYRETTLTALIGLNANYSGLITSTGEGVYQINMTSSVDTGAYNEAIPPTTFNMFSLNITEGSDVPFDIFNLPIESSTGSISSLYFEKTNQAVNGTISGTLTATQSGSGTAYGGFSLAGNVKVEHVFELYRPDLTESNKKIASIASGSIKALTLAVSNISALYSFKDVSEKIANGANKTIILEPIKDLISAKYDLYTEITGTPENQYRRLIEAAEEATMVGENLTSIGLCLSALANPQNAGPCGAAGAAAWADVAQAGLEWLVTDPPNSDYKVIGVYEDKKFIIPAGAPAESVAYIALLNDMYDVSTYLGLATSALEKYQGAILAGDVEWALKQFTEFSRYEVLAKESIAGLNETYIQYQNVLIADNQMYESQSLDNLRIALNLLKNDPELYQALLAYMSANDPENLIRVQAIIENDIEASIAEAAAISANNRWSSEETGLALAGFSGYKTFSAVPAPNPSILLSSAVLAFSAFRLSATKKPAKVGSLTLG